MWHTWINEAVNDDLHNHNKMYSIKTLIFYETFLVGGMYLTLKLTGLFLKIKIELGRICKESNNHWFTSCLLE